LCIHHGISAHASKSIHPLTSLKVSLDPLTKRPVAISPLLTTTPKEKTLFELGQKNYNLKKAASKLTLRKQTPNDEESDLIHALWLAQLDCAFIVPLISQIPRSLN
jgi:hypothetical protein